LTPGVQDQEDLNLPSISYRRDCPGISLSRFRSEFTPPGLLIRRPYADWSVQEIFSKYFQMAVSDAEWIKV
jgi:hypothetical protein